MKRNHEKQKGAVMIMVTVIIAFSMLMLAFALDIGWILSTKSELQHGADAAALASVGKILTGNNELVVSDASVWAAFNKAATLDKQVLESVEVGYLHNPLDPNDSLITDPTDDNFKYYNTVRVKSSMNDELDGSHPLNLFMTAFTGEDKVNLGMYAYATIDSRVYAPSPPPGSPGDSSDGGSTWESSDVKRSIYGDKLLPFTMREESFYPINYTDKDGTLNEWYKNQLPPTSSDFYNEDHPHGLFSYTGLPEDDPRNADQYHYYNSTYGKYFTYEDRYIVDFSVLDEYLSDDGTQYVIPIGADITLPITRTKDRADGIKIGDGIPELPLYLYDEAFGEYPDGNWGTVQFGAGNFSTKKVESQILNGVQSDEYYYVFGDVDDVDGFYGENVANADPGKSLGFMDAFDDETGKGANAQDGALGKIRFLLLHTSGTGSGGNATYTVTGIVPVVIVDNIKLAGHKEKEYYQHYQGIKMGGEDNNSDSARYVIVQPLKAIPKLGSGDEYESSYDGGGIVFYDEGAAFSPDAPPNDFIYTYALVR